MQGQLPAPRRTLPRAAIALLAIALLAALLFTAGAVLAQPLGFPPQDAPWTVPNVQVNTAAAGTGTVIPYAVIAALPGADEMVSLWTVHASGSVYAARSANGGATWYGQAVIPNSSASPASPETPPIALAVSGTGTVHAAWLNSGASDHTVYYDRSDNRGATWLSAPTSISTGVGSATSPDIVSRGANLYYAWIANLQIKLARSANGGSMWAATAVYTPTSGFLSGDLSLAADVTGTLHLVWDESTAVGPAACTIRSTNGGVSWSARSCPVQLGDATTPTDPDLAIDPGNGWLHMVYLDDTSGIPLVMHRYSNTGGASWSAAVAVSEPGYTATAPTIIVSGTHTLYAAWTDGPRTPQRTDRDIYSSRSLNDGLTWAAPGRVNDHLIYSKGAQAIQAATQEQQHAALAAGSNGPRAIWSDYRSGSQWDIYSAAISATCAFPLTGVILDGLPETEPGVATGFTAILEPPDADPPISYNWSPPPGAGQGTANATYTWPTPGDYPITVTVGNCGGNFASSMTVYVMCSAGLTGVYIGLPGGGPPFMAGATVSLTAITTPTTPSPVVSYNWSPAPLTGQGTAVATYSWQAVGSHPVTVTATNCGGTVSGSRGILVADWLAPRWGGLSPSGWITTTQSPSLLVVVSDTQSGLDVSTGQYQFTSNAGSSWSGWTAAPVSGSDYTTANQTLTAANVPFGRDSTVAGGETRIRFRVADMGGTIGESTPYYVLIDTTPPGNPASITSNRATSAWFTGFTAVMTWTAAADAGSGVAGYSYEWSTDAAGLPPAVISTTGLSAVTLIPAYGQHWYFAVRTVDAAGNWSPTATHKGPYWVGSTPSAFLTLDPESGGPGAEAVLTGFGFDPLVTLSIGFTSTAGTHWLGSVQTTYDGVFQAAATVPDTATVTTAHGFIVQGGGKSARAAFGVTQGMQILILNPNDTVNPGGYAWIKAIYANKFGSLLLEWAGADYAGPFPMGGVTTKQASLQVPMDAISGTHTLTVTNRVDGYIVQRSTALFHVVTPVPPATLTTTLPTITAAPNHGIRGTIVDVTGVAPSACQLWSYGGTTYLDCKDTALTLELRKTTDPVTGTTKSVVSGAEIHKSTVTIDPYTGRYTGTLKLKDDFTATFFNEPWGDYNLCLFSDYQKKVTGYTPPEALALADTQAEASGQAPAGVPLPTVTPIPGQGEQTGGQQTWVVHQRKIVACTPFKVEEPQHYVESIRMADTWGNYLDQSKSPQIVLRGLNTGYLTGTHPVKVSQTLVQTNGLNGNPAINVAEGNYWIDAFACGYVPKTGIPVQNNGRGGTYSPPSRAINLAPNGGLGPSPRGVEADFSTALDKTGKIGPFLSFQGALYKPSNPPVVPITIWFNNQLEVILSVAVALPGGGSIQATHQPVDPSDPTRDVWTATLDVTNFPAGQVSAAVTAFGHYKVDAGNCPPNDLYSAPWPIPIVMVPAPGWLKRPLASPSVTYDASERTYIMSGSVGQAVPGRNDWTIVPGEVPLDYLGGITNRITAQVSVAETFNILTGEWLATVHKISGESGILCFPEGSGLPGTTGCVQQYPQNGKQLVASPASGTVLSAGDASMPYSYTWDGQLSSKSYGPWTVYNGVVASYWGIVNVNLSISFGASSQATMKATLLSDLNPNPIHIDPSATLNGNISLWVDILLGVASAGVSGQPYLTVGFPVDIISDTVAYDDATVCFGLNGEVWASMLWWEASFGPFEIFKTGHCSGMSAAGLGLMAATPPPSTLAAPSLAADGFGHLLGTWVHNSSADPGKNIGVMYYVYWDGATWSDGAPGVSDPSFLISDPEVAFAGPGKALALFASNSSSISATKPVTWSQVTGQVANQEIAYSVFNGQAWSAPQYLTNAQGPSGRLTLAGDPLHGQLMAAWVHDISTPAQKKWVIEYAVYHDQPGGWTAPGVAASPINGHVLAEPNLAFNSVGEAALVFVDQQMVAASDTITTPFNDNAHRTTGVYKWSPSTQGWLSMMPNIPKGALMPSVAFDLNDKPIVAYSLYDKDKGGGPTGIGNNNLLGYAILTGTQWITKTHGTVRGVERPRVIPLKDDLAVILFRGFGAVNTPEFSGVPMAVTVNPLKPNNAPSLPGKITLTPGWMYSGISTGAGNQSGQLVTLGVHNLVTSTVFPAFSSAGMAPAMSAAGGMVPFAGAADDVMLMNVPIQPDLAISTTDILVGDTVPLTGTMVPVTVTVRNLGLAATTLPANLKVFQDLGEAGEKLVWSGAAPAGLMFMDSSTFTFQWQAVSGVHKLTVRVYPALAEDSNGENNIASYLVGSPAPPTGLTVSVSWPGPTAGLVWTASAGQAISGYVVYRAVGTDTLQAVAAVSTTAYLDTDLADETMYRYAVSSFTDVGIESALSEEAVAIVPKRVFLPVIARNAAP